MNKKQKVKLYSLLLIIGVAIFILQLFVFSAPNGIVGLFLCLFSVYLMLGSIIKLCKNSEYFKKTIVSTLFDIMFWIP